MLCLVNNAKSEQAPSQIDAVSLSLAGFVVSQDKYARTRCSIEFIHSALSNLF